LAAAFRNRHNMIGIPERFASAQTPSGDGFSPGSASEALDVVVLGETIGSANRAHAAVPFENPVAQMAGVATQTPLLNAPIRAERQAARRNLQAAPAAQAAAVRSLRESVAAGASARHDPLRAHKEQNTW
jgi:hypothetical protein